MSEARRYLSLSLADMLGLSVEMEIFYKKAASSMSKSSVTVDFNLTFGSLMESFVSHKDRLAELMWTWQLENSSEISGELKSPSFPPNKKEMSLPGLVSTLQR